MIEDTLVPHIITVSWLLFVVIVSAMFLKKVRFPYTIGLVIAGMAVAFLASLVAPEQVRAIDTIYFSPAVVLYILLPTLIFQAAITIDSRLLLKNIFPVVILAIPGVFLSTLFVGSGLHLLAGMDLLPAFIFGALISATDPVAVIHLFKEIGVPKKLEVLVDGESLFNDAAAIVLFEFLITLTLRHGGSFSPGSILDGVWHFNIVFFGGLLMGIIVAYLMSLITRSANDDPMVQVASMTLVAYLAFTLSNYYLELSGVMATLAAGIVTNWYGTLTLSEEVKTYIKGFWNYSSFLANSIIFLLLGISALDTWQAQEHSPDTLWYIACAITLVVVARSLVVYVLLPAVNVLFHRKEVKPSYKHIIFWGGLRGALPLALSFSLDRSYPGRSLIIALTLSLVLFTLFFQGTTLQWLMAWLGLDRMTPLEELNRLETRVALKRSGLRQLDRMEHEGCFEEDSIEQIREIEAAGLESLQAALATPVQSGKETRKRLLWHHVLVNEQRIYAEQHERGFIPLPVLKELELNVQMTRDKLKQGEYPQSFVFVQPLETKIKAWSGRLLGFLSRNDLTMRLIQEAYLTKYDVSLALVIASTAIEPIIKELGSLYNLDDALIKECLEVYRKRKDAAMQYIRDIDLEDVPLSYREEKVHLAVLNAEADELKSRDQKEAVLEKVYHELKREVDSVLTSVKAQLSRKN